METTRRAVQRAKSEDERTKIINEMPAMTRAEFQLLKRSMEDNRKLPLFLGLFALTFEFFPIVVYVLRNWISGKLPRPCQQPSQVELVRNQAVERWRRTEEKWRGVDPGTLDQLSFIMYMAEFHDLGMSVIPLKWQPWFVLMGRVKRHVEYLRYDDVLIGRNGVEGLIDDEVIISSVERGIWDPETDMKVLRERLQKSVRQSFYTEEALAREARQQK
jgi:hypothetical protein